MRPLIHIYIYLQYIITEEMIKLLVIKMWKSEIDFFFSSTSIYVYVGSFTLKMFNK